MGSDMQSMYVRKLVDIHSTILIVASSRRASGAEDFSPSRIHSIDIKYHFSLPASIFPSTVGSAVLDSRNVSCQPASPTKDHGQ